MPGFAARNARLSDQIGAIMTRAEIRLNKITSSENIRTQAQAIQWLYQKMKLSGRYTKASKVTVGISGTIMGGVGAGVGAIVGPVGAVAVGAAGVFAGGGLGAIMNKTARGGKRVWKSLKGTRGKHRNQAAEVILEKASDYNPRGWIGDNSALPSWKVLLLFYDESNLYQLVGTFTGRATRETAIADVMNQFKS